MEFSVDKARGCDIARPLLYANWVDLLEIIYTRQINGSENGLYEVDMRPERH